MRMDPKGQVGLIFSIGLTFRHLPEGGTVDQSCR